MAVKLTGRALLESEGLFTLKGKPGPGLCPVAGCRKKSKRGRSVCAGLCSCHYTQRWRMQNPGKSGYQILRHHAKQRGLEFNLPELYYLGLMDCAAAWDRDAEKRGDVVTLDRQKAHLGYVMGNVVVRTLSENVIKGNRERYLPEVVQSMLARKRARFVRIDDAYEARLAASGDPF